jgi:hypothetical protein
LAVFYFDFVKAGDLPLCCRNSPHFQRRDIPADSKGRGFRRALRIERLAEFHALGCGTMRM